MSLCYQDPKNRFFLWTILVLVSLICAAYFLGNGLSQNEYKQVCTTTYYFILFSCLSLYIILYYFHRRDSQDGDSFIQHRLQSQMHARFLFFSIIYIIFKFWLLLILFLFSIFLDTMPSSFWNSFLASWNSCYNIWLGNKALMGLCCS